MILQDSQPEVLGRSVLNIKGHSPVRENSEEGAEKRANPINPVIGEIAIDNGRTEGTGWVDTGCENWCISKCRPNSRHF